MAQILAPYDIGSIHSKHPHLPQELVDTLRLDIGLAHNAPLTPKLIKEAEDTAVALEQIQEFHAPITDAVIQTAKGRATLISQAYSNAEFNVPAPPAAALMDAVNALQASMKDMQEDQRRMEESLQQLGERQRRIEAWKDNARIGQSNTLALVINRGLIVYQARVKEVAGDGTALANALAPSDVAQLVALSQPPVVGTAYADTIDTSDLTHQMILNLIQFYNEDFEIVLGDCIGTRAQKVRDWLKATF